MLLVAFVGVASSYLLTVGRYEIRSPKIASPIRLLLIADLHSCYYGPGQQNLVRAIDVEHPNALMFCGDIADDKLPIENTRILLKAVAGRYPCFYVTGNHEFWSGKPDEIKDLFREYGVTVLEGDCVLLAVKEEMIVVCGVDDPDGGFFRQQLPEAAEGTRLGRYSVLLSHRPERLASYAQAGFDLVLSGHAHGGLWRIPGILKGFVAPNQGFFPKYTSGVYREGKTAMVVSRGLARESTRIPRFFNSTEIVVVDLFPE